MRKKRKHVKRGIVIESHASRGEKGEGRMRKLMKSFQKRQSIASRVLCFLLVLAMVVTMVPALGGGNSTVQAAENPTVRLYFENRMIGISRHLTIGMNPMLK